MLDFSRCRMVPLSDGTLSGVKDHVKVGVRALIERPYFALFDEMGAMKSAQTIIAAQFLYTMSIIDRVIVIAPACVRTGVWFDQELGELARHLWDDLPSMVTEFHGRKRQWLHGPESPERLKWIITNYEFIRAQNRDTEQWTRLPELLPYCTPKTLLVLDESSAIANAQSDQAKACMWLRKACGRVVLLNGTPIGNSPGDMFSQGNMMSKTILDCPSYTQFCARYAIMKPVLGRGGKAVTSKHGFVIKTVDKWSGVDEISRRFMPHVLRRLKKDVLPWLPAKNPPIVLMVALSPALWRMYKEMRDELLVWLSTCEVSQAPQAMTKIMRLAQITSGFLGGIEDMDLSDAMTDDLVQRGQEDEVQQHLNTLSMPDDVARMLYRLTEDQLQVAGQHRGPVSPVQEVGSEKQDAFIDWLDEVLIEDPCIKVLVRSRFRPEILRLEKTLQARGDVTVGTIIGGQKRADRAAALRLLDPRTMPKGPVVDIMSVSAGALGLNLTGSHTMFTLSNDFSLRNRLQSDDRVHRPGQTEAVSYFDLVATGPTGQKTIDHRVLAAIIAKHDLATLTTSGWRDTLREE